MKWLALLSLLIAAPASAQQMSASDRVAHYIGQLFIQVQQQQDTIQSLQDQLTKAQTRIKELEAKEAPK